MSTTHLYTFRQADGHTITGIVYQGKLLIRRFTASGASAAVNIQPGDIDKLGILLAKYDEWIRIQAVAK